MPPANQPTPDTGQYNFILQNGQSGQKRGLPKLSLAGPVKLILLIGAFLLLIILFFALRSNSSSNPPLLSVAARQAEILRVTSLATANLADKSDQNLAATVTAALTSQKTDLIKKLGIKSSDGRLANDQNKSIDASLKTAQQNNNYDATYLGWLKPQLTNLQQLIQSAAASASPSTKTLLQSDLSTAQTLLAAPQLKNL